MAYNIKIPMDNFSQMHIFFLISSLGFIVLFVLVTVFLFYLNRSAKTFSRIMDRAEKDIDKLGDTTREILEDMRDSVIFNFLFGRKKKRRKE